MASVKVASKIPFALHNGSSKPQDDSYSNYLGLVRENFPSELHTPELLSCQISLNRRRTPDGEIEIFDAEKYFSGALDGGGSVAATPQRLPPLELGVAPPPIDPDEAQATQRWPVRASSRAGSVSSETSCNSRSTLLRDHHRRHAVVPGPQIPDISGKARFAGVFRCCSCARKNAIDVDKDALSDARPARPHVEHLVSDLRLKRISPGLTQAAFAFPPSAKEEKAAGVPINAVFFAQRKSFGIVPSGRAAGGANGSRHDGDEEEEDVRSDASSDLFEIESTSMNSLHPLVASTGYEPSEASVEWSVATASVANFSIASESDGRAATLRRAGRAGGSGLLLGCVSEKAVGATAAGPAARASERKSVDRDGTATPSARYRVESCGVDLGSGLRAGRVLPPSPFGSSRSSQE